MPGFRNAASSFIDRDLNEGIRKLSLHGSGAHPGLGPGPGVAVAHQLDELLRSRDVAAIATLQRHGAANPWSLQPGGIGSVDPQVRRAIGCGHVLDPPPAGLAGCDMTANIDVAVAHDCFPC
jgi:hypothetical protein